MRTTEYLPADRKLVDAVADWLLPRVRTDASGAPSLSHLLLVVPTAQANRQLRLALASRAAVLGLGGILPPDVRLPMQLVVPADGSLPVATPFQLRAAFLRFLSSLPPPAAEEDSPDDWTRPFRTAEMADFRSALAFFDQLRDIWSILSGAGLVMQDVPLHPKAREVLAAAQGDETARWERLAAFEKAFFSFLRAHGLRPESESVKLAKTAPQPLPDEIEEVVLPALVDPMGVLYDVLERQRPALRLAVLVHAAPADAAKFDAWGRPEPAAWTGPEWTGTGWRGPARPVLAGLRDRDIVRAAGDGELAQKIVRDFPSAESGKALPALGLCDASLHPELAAAFLNAGYDLHNPEKRYLLLSSLGRLAANLLAAFPADACPWDAFAAILRENDAMDAVLRAVAKNGQPGRTDVLAGLDLVRNAFLPRTVPAECAFDEERFGKPGERVLFRAFRTAARGLLAMMAQARAASSSPAGFLRAMLQRLYASRKLDAQDDGDREFASAAQALRGVLDQADEAEAAAAGLPAGAAGELLRRSLEEATYATEPETKDAIRTEGWLELAWSAADKIALAGFHEGAVPDSVAGHPFLPDSLRAALGLGNNRRRLARDTYLLHALLAARAGKPGAVRAYVSTAGADGDIHRPSRLLFLVDDAALAGRAERLFGELAPGEPLPARGLEDAWRPKLPDEANPPGKRADRPLGAFSASAIDSWLRCPFTYLFEHGLEMHRTRELDELDAPAFGNLVHAALEAYAAGQLARGAEPLAGEKEIAAEFAKILDVLRGRFGRNPGVKIALQFEAAAKRLACFAAIEAKWISEGWRIALPPEYPIATHPFREEGFRDVLVKGAVDRIDVRETADGRKEYRLIDYKTWDKASGAWGKILKGGPEAEHAARLALPVTPPDAKGRTMRLLTVQLPLYGRCLETQNPEIFLDGEGRSRIADFCYAILGRSPGDVAVLGSAFDQTPFEAVRSKSKPVLAAFAALALETAKTAVARIRENVFWPPGPSEAWKRDIRELLAFSPEKDFPPGTAWRDRQEEKLARLASQAEGGA